MTRSIVVKGNRGTLATLGDAGKFLAEHFDTVLHFKPLEEALAALVKAAERGAPKDKEAATRAVEILLSGRGWL